MAHKNYKLLVKAAALLVTTFWFCGVAQAQLAITTIGATKAEACFKIAAYETSTGVADCDGALDEAYRLTKKDIAHTHVNRGIILNRALRLDEAIKDFDEALSILPDLAEAFLNRGNSYYLKQRYSEALTDYDTALEKGLRKTYAAHYNKGLVYLALMRKDEARAEFEKALAANPDFAPARRKLEGMTAD